MVVIRRLHRMVRHGYRPWLGYDVASGQDRDVQLHRKDGIATLEPDGTVRIAAGPAGTPTASIAAEDTHAFDAAFPPDMPNRRNLVRRLYEMGFGSS